MKIIINVKTDVKVKKDAQKIAEELGLSLSAVVNAQLKQFVRDRSVYFSTIPRMTRGLEDILGEAEKDFITEKNLSPYFSSAHEAAAYLKKL